MTQSKGKRKFDYDERINPQLVFSNAPKKVGAPILSVLENNKTLGEILSNVWINQPETRAHMLGSALFITTCGYSLTQMRDVVKMRYAANSPVNLTWSPNRWRNEHDLGQRRATADRLSEQNATYVNKDIEALLTDFGRNCLVRTSRELGEHALEMLHCVASYHDSVLRGTGMVLRIEHNSQLYTGWVFITHMNEGKKLYLGQLCGVRNEKPATSIREEICDKLGTVDHQTHTRSAAQSRDVIPAYLGDREFYRQLEVSLKKNDMYKNRQIAMIRWEFRGGGDSGQLDSIEFVLDDGSCLWAHSWLETASQDAPSGQQYGFEIGAADSKRPNLKFTWDFWGDTSDLCDLANWDWWNGDGGGVNIELNVDSLELDVGGYYCFTETEDCSGPVIDLSHKEGDQ